MSYRLEGQLEYDPDTGGIFISLFPYPGEEPPSSQQILDAVSDLLIDGWRNEHIEKAKLNS